MLISIVFSQYRAQERVPEEEIWVKNIGSGANLLSLPSWFCLLAG